MNTLIKLTLIIASLSFASTTFSQKLYKEMMKDPSYNFYDVCKEADKYFSEHSKGKGSGYKGYMRWRNQNESRYAPSGVRNNIDPLFVEKEYQRLRNIMAPAETLNRGVHPGGWVDLGPYSIDSITGHYSAGLGRVETVYVDPTNTQILYLGSRSGGFWKSTDGGATWEGGSTDTLPASGVFTLSVSPTNSDSILIAVQNSRNSSSHGIYRSIDGGSVWKETAFNPTNLGLGGLGSNFRVYMLAYHPRVSDLIFVGTSNGLYRSTDNLATWTRIASTSTGDITQIQFHPTDNNIVYIYDDYFWGSNQNVVRYSLDQGLTFSSSNTIAGNNDASAYLSVSNDCPDCVFFASSNGIWTSTNKGIDFTFKSNPPESCRGFAVNDLDTSKMLYGYVDLVTTADGANTSNQVTWWSLGSSNHGPGNFDFRLNNSGKYVHADLRNAICVNGVYYIGTDGYMAKSANNGASWEILSNGTGIRENYSLGASQSNYYRTMSGSQDNGTSIRHKDHWIEFYGADGMEAIIHPLNDDFMIGSVQFGTRRKTEDGGLTQYGVSPSGQNGSGNGAWEAPLAYDPNDQMRVYNFAKNIYSSDEFGGNWSFLSNPFGGGTISQAAIAENNSDIMVISRGGSLRKSTDRGATFINIYRPPLPNSTITDIAFNPNDDDNIFVTYNRYQNDGNKIFMSTDGGATWVNITYNLGDMPLADVVIDHTNESNIYVGAEIGVYTKALNDTVWKLYNANLPNTTVTELEVVNGANSLKATLWGRGLWEYHLVGRKDYPSIVKTWINDMPTTQVPREDIDQHVTSLVSSDTRLTAVYCEWSVGTPTFGNRIGMVNISDSTYYSIDPLPNYPVGTKMFFKVFAVNENNDTTETYKFQYTVRFNPRASIEVAKEDKLELKIYPNPTEGQVKLAFEKVIKEGTITLFDELGKQIMTQQIRGLNSVELDIRDFSAGLYYVVVQGDEGKRSVKKLIKK